MKYKIPCIEISELYWRDINQKYGTWSIINKREAQVIRKQLIKLIKRLPK